MRYVSRSSFEENLHAKFTIEERIKGFCIYYIVPLELGEEMRMLKEPRSRFDTRYYKGISTAINLLRQSGVTKINIQLMSKQL